MFACRFVAPCCRSWGSARSGCPPLSRWDLSELSTLRSFIPLHPAVPRHRGPFPLSSFMFDLVFQPGHSCDLRVLLRRRVQSIQLTLRPALGLMLPWVSSFVRVVPRFVFALSLRVLRHRCRTSPRPDQPSPYKGGADGGVLRSRLVSLGRPLPLRRLGDGALDRCCRSVPQGHPQRRMHG